MDYIASQLGDFRNGNRKNSVGNTIMVAIAQALTTTETKAAADYYSGLKLKPWIKVVEARSAPRTRIIEGNLRLPNAPAATEALGERIVEVPEDPSRTRLYDSHAGFVAYVPLGSLKRGEHLVTTGGATMVQGKKVAGKTMECSQCHGRDLRGMPAGPGAPSPTPPLAGRSPTYIVRQLYDMQQGARRGANAELMKPVVAQLTRTDIISIASYLASRTP
jgi:cytochrome c553